MKTTGDIKTKQRENHCRAVAKYQRTAKGKEAKRRARAKYRRSAKGKIIHRKSLAEYRRTEKGRQRSKRSDKTYRLRNPDKERARHAVGSAIRSGKLEPAKHFRCVYCGRDAVHYHHWHGYDKIHWLDVVPVCKKCHTETHYSVR